MDKDQHISIAELGRLFELSTIIDGHSDGVDFHSVKDAIANDLIEREPLFRGKPLELWLCGFYEEWMHQSPASNFNLPRSVYIVARSYQALARSY